MKNFRTHILAFASVLSLTVFAQERTFTIDKTVPDYNGDYGYDMGTRFDPASNAPYFFSVKVPDGNYVVTVTVGDRRKDAQTFVRAESRRLMVDNARTPKGKTADYTFVVNKRSDKIAGSDKSVRLNKREVGSPTWDDRLTLEINGANPAVRQISIRPVTEADSVTTVFLCGNSTVVDQGGEPWASWGQIVPAFFDTKIVISNNAESGESAASSLASNRLDKVLSMAKPGDWLFIEYGHNDQKAKAPGSGAYYDFSTNLKKFIDLGRQKGLEIVLVTPAARRRFDKNGKCENTHGEYVQAVRDVAARENVRLIDLNPMVMQLYETLGTEGSKKALVHYPAGTFPNQEKALSDNTHFNPYGATQLAKCMLMGIRAVAPELASHIINVGTYSPLLPDDPATFEWPLAPTFQSEKPLGN